MRLLSRAALGSLAVLAAPMTAFAEDTVNSGDTAWIDEGLRHCRPDVDCLGRSGVFDCLWLSK